MKVYRSQKRILVNIQPGNEFPETSDFNDIEGNAILFPVQFEDYKAEVSQAVGRYMIDKKFAFASFAAARSAEPVIVHA